jgi:proteasome lid subunit RPN8/RPN11
MVLYFLPCMDFRGFWAKHRGGEVKRESRLMGWHPPDESTRAAFANLIADSSARDWVASHVHREFPRLACGAVFINARGELRTLALPNVDTRPEEKWALSPQVVYDLDREALTHQEELIGFFSTRAPGKAASPEEISPAPAWVKRMARPLQRWMPLQLTARSTMDSPALEE